MITTLYKYMKKKHAINFMNKGVVRIGTLYDFRKSDKYGDQVGDQLEGTKTVHAQGPYILDTDRPATIPYFLEKRINLGEGNRLTIVAKGGVAGLVEDPDAYIYCFSSVFDSESMRAMGYDSCIEIFNPEGFVSSISRKVSLRADFKGMAPCIYRNRRVEWQVDDDIPATLIKEEQHSHQNEVRAVWMPKKQKILKPFSVQVKKATKYCRIMPSS